MARLLGITRFWNYISDWIECRVHLRPEKDNALDLGSSDYQWRRVYVGPGTVGAPAITPDGDANTGLWQSAADNLDFSTGGTNRLNISSTGLSVTGAVSASSTITSTSGAVAAGVNDTTSGTFTAYGAATGTEGGQVTLYMTGDYDATVESWAIDVYQDDLRFFSGSNVWLSIKQEGDLHLGHGGDASTPVLTWSGDPDTGIYRSAANNLDFSTGGTNRLNISSAGAKVTGNVDPSGFFNFGPYTELTISGGAITVTGSLHSVDTEGDEDSDDLETINGGSTGDILVLRSANSNRDVVLKDKTAGGNLYLAGDCTLNWSVDTITLMRFSSDWYELSRSNNL